MKLKTEMDSNTWGVFGHLTSEQKAVLEKVRQHVTENKFPSEFDNDKILLRFCRARKFKVKLVTKMLDTNRCILINSFLEILNSVVTYRILKEICRRVSRTSAWLTSIPWIK